jgi:hypothetical protein
MQKLTQRQRQSLNVARSEAIKASKDFEYGENVIAQLKQAKSEAEISSIMRKARYEMFE